MEFIRNIINALNCCKEDDLRSGEVTERTALLQHNGEHRALQITRISETIDADEYPSSLPTREKDEQSALNRIVQETNSNIIDVAALETHHILQQSEYNDRVKLYNQRLAQQWNSISTSESNYNGLLKDMPNPEILLSFNPSAEDILMAKEFIKETATTINDMKIDNHEDLVVPFQVT